MHPRMDHERRRRRWRTLATVMRPLIAGRTGTHLKNLPTHHISLDTGRIGCTRSGPTTPPYKALWQQYQRESLWDAGFRDRELTCAKSGAPVMVRDNAGIAIPEAEWQPTCRVPLEVSEHLRGGSPSHRLQLYSAGPVAPTCGAATRSAEKPNRSRQAKIALSIESLSVVLSGCSIF